MALGSDHVMGIRRGEFQGASRNVLFARAFLRLAPLLLVPLPYIAAAAGKFIRRAVPMCPPAQGSGIDF